MVETRVGRGGVESCQRALSLRELSAGCDVVDVAIVDDAADAAADDDDDDDDEQSADAGAEAARKNKPESLPRVLFPTSSSSLAANAIVWGAEGTRSSKSTAAAAAANAAKSDVLRVDPTRGVRPLPPRRDERATGML
jgi:hypothetical protein